MRCVIGSRKDFFWRREGGVATNSLEFLRVVEEQARGEYLIMI